MITGRGSNHSRNMNTCKSIKCHIYTQGQSSIKRLPRKVLLVGRILGNAKVQENLGERWDGIIWFEEKLLQEW